MFKPDTSTNASTSSSYQPTTTSLCGADSILPPPSWASHSFQELI